MSRRSFSVYGTRRVLKLYEEEYRYDVYADSFDEAREKVNDGMYDDREWQDDNLLDDSYEVLDDPYEITRTDCDECSNEEEYCECDESENEDCDPYYAERISEPGTFVESLQVGEWYEPDAYTFDRWFSARGPIKIRDYPSGPDSDGDYYVCYQDEDGERRSEYVRRSAKFISVADPSLDPEAAEEQRREREEAANKHLQRKKEESAIRDLLAPTGW